MFRFIAIAALGSAALVCAPAQAQQSPQLEGAPGVLKTQKPSAAPKNNVSPTVSKPAPKPAPKAAAVEPDVFRSALDKTRVREAELTRQADALKVEQGRLERLDASFKAREADLAAREKLLADRDAQLTTLQADLTRQREDVARQLAQVSARQAQLASREGDNTAPAPPVRSAEDSRRYRTAGLDRETAVEACLVAGEDEAHDRDFFSAEYEGVPRVSLGRTTEVRGLMRLRDRRGSVVLNSICEVDADGEPQRFVFMR